MQHEEEDLQIQCVRWFGYQYPRLAILLHHSPNGGRRSLLEAQRFKAMGTRKGFPDLVLLLPSAGYHGLFMELKSRKGVQRESQKAYQRAVQKFGYKYEIVRSLEQFIDCIRLYLGSKQP